ncbi:hypothetical protein [Gayadomonas joobiniege]|uniref:hypothetical protein n=1 Tax=Gayadomonas joobiniege TaxID=1234606 RepID=UPI000374C826|nr:hypothetical protein [Gayadomonas joobiniege]
MKLKSFALCAIAAAMAGCTIDTDTSTDNNQNTLGSIALTGTAKDGDTLTVSVEDPDGISGSVSYYWYADGAVIEGANSNTLTLTEDHIGKEITAQAMYTDEGGTNESHISDPTTAVAAVPFDGTVTISGEAVIGNTLTANVADDNGIDDTTVISYEWFAGSNSIDGEVTSELTLTEEHFGEVITVQATYQDIRGFDESPTSAPTAAVTRENTEGTVDITGTPTVGNTLTAEITDADGVPTSVSYQWFAGDQAISGETSANYVVEDTYLGETISVQVIYTDENGFDEDNTSAPTVAVTDKLVDAAGTVTIMGTAPYLVDAPLTAELSDDNGVTEANVSYTWSADGQVIAGETSKTFTPTNHAGAIISVSVNYTDDDGFTATVTDELASVVYTTIVNDVNELNTTLSNGLFNGQVVGLNTNVYADLDAITIDKSATLRALEGESPTITGDLCIHVTSETDGAKIQGITFANIDTKAGSTCATEESAIIYSEGANFVFSHNTMGGDQSDLNTSDPQWVMLKGSAALVERNTFTDRDHATAGSIIKMSSSSSDHVIQYNLFKGTDANPNYSNSSLHLFNVGSTTGTDAANNANFTIRYNRVEGVVTGRRMMRVQTSNAQIYGNTIIDTNGGISLEDGGFNNVSDNIIIRTTNIADTDDRPAGILATPFGHTISNNYIAGIRSSNKEAGGIVFTANPLSQADGGVPNSGNQAVLDSAGDFTLTVTNNTILNSVQPIVFSTEIGSKAPVGDCDELTAALAPELFAISWNFFKINFDANLIANGLNENSATQGLAFDSEDISSDHAFEYDCDLVDRGNSSFTNNFGFTDSYYHGDAKAAWDTNEVLETNANGNGAFDTDGAIDQNPADNGKEVPELVTANNGLVETDANGAQAAAGAKGLYYINESDVGAGSTWTMSNN